MKIRVIDKEESAPLPRTGEVAALYNDLVALMKDAPGKKAVVDFGHTQTSYRAQCKMTAWAAEDGLTLFARAIKGTTERELYLEKSTEEEDQD